MERARETRVHRAGVGYAFEAPGVYLWDEDRLAVERAAQELRSGIVRRRATQRMLVIPAQEIAPLER
ncbi:MAG TPA: hypothetical protein VFT98_06250 [Myxococcota bacterium]|nr:hypothetical protein [Myxococcota bacterium]